MKLSVGVPALFLQKSGQMFKAVTEQVSLMWPRMRWLTFRVIMCVFYMAVSFRSTVSQRLMQFCAEYVPRQATEKLGRCVVEPTNYLRA